MLANTIYLVVFIILAFVLSIAVKAITRGVEAKQTLKEEKNLQVNKEENEISNIEIVKQLKELKDLHDKGIISNDEFKKAKEKILN
jgi:large-conductance mechanosensitive channel